MDTAFNPLDRLALPPDRVRLIGRLDEFKGRWKALGDLAPERLGALRRIATIESVGSSTRIEGARLSNDEVEKLLAGLDPWSLRSRDEAEVAGYAELMELIFESWSEMSLTENHILQLHRTMLTYSGKDEHHRGKYKVLPNSVDAFDDEGRSLGTVFETATPFDTPRLMRELVAWARTALDEQAHHPLLVIAVFVLRFLAIHPFQDGNGRLSRALTTLLLMRSGYTYVPYSSLERIVEQNKSEYYRRLRRGQATLGRDESQLLEWISFFLNCLLRQCEDLERKVERERAMAPVSPLSSRLIDIVTEHGRTTVRDATALTGSNRNTVKTHLRRLVAAGRLVQHGRGKGTWYEKP
jgi:Fic family protein